MVGSPTGVAVNDKEAFWQTVNDGFGLMVTVGAAFVIPVKSEKPVTPFAVRVFELRAVYFTQGSEPLYLPATCPPSVPAISADT